MNSAMRNMTVIRSIIAGLGLLIASPAQAAGWVASSDPSVVCHAGYSASVRPSEAEARAIKRQILGGFGNMRGYELDHIVPLALGGDPRDPRNLQLQPWDEAEIKDRLEWKLLKLACYRHQLTLPEAQAAFSDWKSAYWVYCPTETDCPAYHGGD